LASLQIEHHFIQACLGINYQVTLDSKGPRANFTKLTLPHLCVM